MTMLQKLPAVHRPPPLRAPSLPAPIDARASTAPADPDDEAEVFDSQLKIVPGIELPLRSMLVSHGDRNFLISPVDSPDERRAASSHPVTLIAPSLLHHIHMRDAIARHHCDDVWGPPGLRARCPELGLIREFGRDEWPHRDALDVVVVEGAPARNELVCFHPPTRTIYTADLVFNLLEPSGFATPLAYRLMGVWKRFAVPRMWKHWVKDRAAFRRSIDQIMAWDFSRIVMAHGEILRYGGREMLGAALSELGLY